MAIMQNPGPDFHIQKFTTLFPENFVDGNGEMLLCTVRAVSNIWAGVEQYCPNCGNFSSLLIMWKEYQ